VQPAREVRMVLPVVSDVLTNQPQRHHLIARYSRQHLTKSVDGRAIDRSWRAALADSEGLARHHGIRLPLRLVVSVDG
jgi:hypothetical protein